MPTPAYITIEGKTQGNITKGAFTADSVGNIYQEGHEDQRGAALSYAHEPYEPSCAL